ncbi:MAG TPA: carboxymuconolactone decarboxylase family protein [Bryobacteraceae bacterium]|nr:carboxymuconolactone decarboxylase family protein [Bryobacteraceae bacterium]
MTARSNYSQAAPGVLKAMMGLEAYLASSTLDRGLKLLVVLRASQMNHCAYCVDLHSHELRRHGETNERIDLLAVWREAPHYTSRERAALAWTEALTHLAPAFVPDEVYAEASAHFDERELADLTLAVAAINAWNRFGVGFRLVPESAKKLAAAKENGGVAG